MALTQIQQAMLADGILTADAAGRLKMADGFVNAAKLGAGAARANFGAGAVLQVVQGTLATQYYRSNCNGWLTCGLEATITPASTSNKILVLVSSSMVSDANHNMLAGGILRGGSYIGGMKQVMGYEGSYGYAQERDFIYYDSPASTSALTYALGINDTNTDGANCYVNRRLSSSTEVTGVSTITLLEIAA